jgi:hypothetical protein
VRNTFDRRFVSAIIGKEDVENVHTSRLLIILDCSWSPDNNTPSPIFRV